MHWVPPDPFFLDKSATVTLTNPFPAPEDGDYMPSERVKNKAFVAWRKGRALWKLLNSFVHWWQWKAFMCGLLNLRPPYFAQASQMEGRSDAVDYQRGIDRGAVCDQEIV